MKEEPLRQMPKDLKLIGRVMSNFDHRIEPKADEILRTTEGIYGQYGWQ